MDKESNFILNGLKEKFKSVKIISIDPTDMVFEERVKMNCYYYSTD